MQIVERKPGDLEELRRRARKEPDALAKDRLIVVMHAIEGFKTQEIEHATKRSRGFVQRWVYAYRDGGIEALRARRRGGVKPTKFPPELHDRLRARIDAGPTEADGGVCVLRIRDVSGSRPGSSA